MNVGYVFGGFRRLALVVASLCLIAAAVIGAMKLFIPNQTESPFMWPHPNPAGYVALTFDDGPFPDTTPAILETLANYKAKATFFVTGENAANHLGLMRQIIDAGHDVGNHTWDHQNLLNLSLEDQLWQLSTTQKMLREQLAITPQLFRPPYDGHNSATDQIARDLAMTVAIWDYDADPQDWNGPNPGYVGRSADEICSHILDTFSNGSVILLHDWNQGTADSLPCIIEGIRSRGYEIGMVRPADMYDDLNKSNITVTKSL